MPVYACGPKGIEGRVRHYGPTAQDFHAAFGLGTTDLGIGQQDADGVALAAIQGLNAKLEAARAAKDAEIAALRAELAEIRSLLYCPRICIPPHPLGYLKIIDPVTPSLALEMIACESAAALS